MSRKWKQVGSNNSSDYLPTHNFRSEPVLEGSYIGVKSDIGPNNANKYTLELDDGTQVEIWGSTVLDDKMQNVDRGSYVRIEYLGKRKGRHAYYHDFSVSVAE